jgi:SAM-dependent methyltransferase
MEADAVRLFDRLADGYDEHFAVPHRRLYDDLAWSRVEPLLPAPPATVVDVGCGVGRWAERLVARGLRVVGIEGSPEMAAAARARAATLGPDRFLVVDAPMEVACLPAEVGSEGAVAAVLAMGSFQYCEDPAGTVARWRSWLAPGAAVAVLVDSLVALGAELVRAGRWEEAAERAAAGRGRWQPEPGLGADLTLYDAAGLQALLAGAGFVDLTAHGLLVSATVVGVPAVVAELSGDAARDAVLRREAALADRPALADLGKQLLVTGRAPA